MKTIAFDGAAKVITHDFLPHPQEPARENPPTITHHHEFGADFALIRRLGLNELHITIEPEPDDSMWTMLLRLNAILREHDAAIARMEVFGAAAAQERFLDSMRRIMGKPSWPVMWIDGAGFGRSAMAGLHVFAVSGTDVEPVRLGRRIVGCAFSDAYARHCMLGDITPTDADASRADQAREVFVNLQIALDAAGMHINDLARTWCYLGDLGEWYGAFNHVWTQLYRQWGMFETGVPASTTVGATNPHRTAIVAGAWATVPMNGAANVRPVKSPLQCAAQDSGSSFARAIEWNTPGHRRITVSGTASIAPGGESVHRGNVRTQVDLTMDVVEAILVSRGLDFSDVTRATAYVKVPRHAGALDDWFERQGLWFPAVTTHADSCRDELLFEIELDAIMEKPATKSDITHTYQ